MFRVPCGADEADETNIATIAKRVEMANYRVRLKPKSGHDQARGRNLFVIYPLLLGVEFEDPNALPERCVVARGGAPGVCGVCALASDNDDPWDRPPRHGRAARSGCPSPGGPCSASARPIGWRLCSRSQVRADQGASASVPSRPAARRAGSGPDPRRGVPAHLGPRVGGAGPAGPEASVEPLRGGRSAVGAETEKQPVFLCGQSRGACPPEIKETISKFPEFGISLLEV